MDIKTGTKTWSEATQRSDFKDDPTQRLSAKEQAKYFEGQDIGEVLNKVADPNWIDPSKKMRAVGDATLDKDAFLKLLLTQLKNQDPTNPMKSHEMAAQLAQFTSLEKLTNIDDGIGELKKVQAPTENFEALGLIGKAVSGDSSQIIRSQDDADHNIGFKLSGDAQSVNVSIYNEQGEEIRKLTYNSLNEGKNEVSWNGLKEDGTKARSGTYRVEIDARAANGKNLMAETKFDGVITGVNFAAGGPVLMIGKQSVKMSDVDKIVDPKLIEPKETQELKAGKPAQDMSQAEPSEVKTGPAQVDKSKEKSQKAEVYKSNLGNVSMSQGMMNKIGDEVNKGS